MYCIVDSALQFSVFVHNWPIREDHPFYQERKHSMKYNIIVELLSFFTNSTICQGLDKDTEVQSVAVDPIQIPPASSRSILCHSIPKTISTEREHFEVSVVYRCVD